MLNLSHDCTMLNAAQQRQLGAVAMILAEQPDEWRGDLQTLLAEEILPAARHGKLVFFLNFDRVPVGFMTWAHLSEETEQRLLGTLDPWLHASEWNEGPSLWIRWLRLPKGLRREGLQLCLDQLFPEAQQFRMMYRRMSKVTALELERDVIERFVRRTT